MGTKANLIKTVPLQPSSQVEGKRAIPVYNRPKLSVLVKDGRKKYHLTQTELAARTDQNSAEISRIESGNILKPSKDVLKALSPYTGVSYSDLLHYAGYSGNIDTTEYYDTKGKLIPYESIINDIYSADADLLGLLENIDSYTSYEDRELLKNMLKLMKELHEQPINNSPLLKVQKVFMATKDFLSIHLTELLNAISHPPDNIIK